MFDTKSLFIEYMCMQVGTVLYLSPELLSGKIHFNADTLLKADMFAFGIVLSQMLRRTSTGDEGFYAFVLTLLRIYSLFYVYVA